MASRVRDGDAISNPPTCLLVEHKKAILLTLVALAAIGALVIGALAMSGVGSISQLGLPGGGAIAGLGFFVLLVIVGYCAYKRCCSISTEEQTKTRKRLRDDSESDERPPKIRRPRTEEHRSSRGEKTASRPHHAPTSSKSRQGEFDYQKAELRDLFIGGDGAQFDRLPPYHLPVPRLDKMTAPIMKGWNPLGEFVCIKLRCISPTEEIIANLDPKNLNNETRAWWLKDMHYSNEGVLILFKKHNTDWVQQTNTFFVDPTFLRPYEFETEEAYISSDEKFKKEQVEKDRQGFAFLQHLLLRGEIMDCQGLHWQIVN